MWKVFTEWWELKRGLKVCMGETYIGLSEVNFKDEKISVRIPVCIAARKERCYM